MVGILTDHAFSIFFSNLACNKTSSQQHTNFKNSKTHNKF